MLTEIDLENLKDFHFQISETLSNLHLNSLTNS